MPSRRSKALGAFRPILRPPRPTSLPEHYANSGCVKTRNRWLQIPRTRRQALAVTLICLSLSCTVERQRDSEQAKNSDGSKNPDNEPGQNKGTAGTSSAEGEPDLDTNTNETTTSANTNNSTGTSSKSEGSSPGGPKTSSNNDSGTSTSSTTPGKDSSEPQPEPEPEPEPTCASKGGECVASPPIGWQGPVRQISGSSSSIPRCEKPFRRELGNYGSGLDQGQARCSCQCDPDLSTFKCGRPSPTLTIHPNDSCKDGMDSVISPLPASQSDRFEGCGGQQVLFEPDATFEMDASVRLLEGQVRHNVDASAARCTPRQELRTLTNPSARKSVRVCEYQEPSKVAGLCEGSEVCVPKQHTRKLCVFRSGSHACNFSDWPVRTEVFEGISDNRSCTSCQCGSGKGRCTDQFSVGGCTSDSNARLRTGLCTKLRGRGFWYDYEAGQVEGAGCEARPGQITGDVSPNNNWTICCSS